MTAGTTDQNDIVTSLSRRKMFAMCSIGVLGATALAACSSDDDAASTPAATSDAATTPASDGAAATTDAAAPATGLIKLADVPVGGSVGLEVAGKPVIVSQPTKGEAVAFSAVCPHQFATVAVNGKELRCPLHGSTFDSATGKNLSGPAAGKPLPPVSVKVVDVEVVQA
jgi:nitrite reductase/ring-hydroxylating ferredoxin subunit